MTKLVLRRKGATLYAPSPEWADIMAELPEHVDLNVNASKARSHPQLGTYFGLLAWVCENVEAASPWPTRHELSDFVQLEVGFVRHIAVPTDNGLVYVRVPASKSFAECSQEQFNAYFDLALTRLVKLCGFDPLPLYMEHMRAKGERRAA